MFLILLVTEEVTEVIVPDWRSHREDLELRTSFRMILIADDMSVGRAIIAVPSFATHTLEVETR
jgi:hypothetical protein